MFVSNVCDVHFLTVYIPLCHAFMYLVTYCMPVCIYMAYIYACTCSLFYCSFVEAIHGFKLPFWRSRLERLKSSAAWSTSLHLPSFPGIGCYNSNIQANAKIFYVSDPNATGRTTCISSNLWLPGLGHHCHGAVRSHFHLRYYYCVYTELKIRLMAGVEATSFAFYSLYLRKCAASVA